MKHRLMLLMLLVAALVMSFAIVACGDDDDDDDDDDDTAGDDDDDDAATCEDAIGDLYGTCGMTFTDGDGAELSEDDAIAACEAGDTFAVCALGCYNSDDVVECADLESCIEDNCM